MCVMEAVAFVAGEEWSDSPKCASPSIAAFLRSWNDSLNNTDRQMLKPLIPKLVGTAASPEVEEKRGYLAIDWFVRVYTPTWLNLANLGEHAEKIKALGEIRNLADLEAAQAVLSAARSAAESAAESAAWSAARSAAWSAAESAARSAARSAAWSAARSAARSAAWSAARSAAETAFEGTVKRLQASALDLVERMIAVRS